VIELGMAAYGLAPNEYQIMQGTELPNFNLKMN
jgi:hypothetical protein